jgi:hypothetical protein
LRLRFEEAPEAAAVGPELLASAKRLRALREQVSASLEGVSACSGCAKGHPEPAGHWEGGHCCSGRTLDVWTEAEVAALKLAGTRMASLEPPQGDHAGCTFRGEKGCTVAPGDRPSLCARYLCLELKGELDEAGTLKPIAKLAADLSREDRRFVKLLTKPR